MKYNSRVLKNGVEVWRIENDINGNPRFLVHFLSLGLDKYESIASNTGLSKYRGKWFGGGYVFSTYRDLEEKIDEVIKILSLDN